MKLRNVHHVYTYRRILPNGRALVVHPGAYTEVEDEVGQSIIKGCSFMHEQKEEQASPVPDLSLGDDSPREPDSTASDRASDTAAAAPVPPPAPAFDPSKTTLRPTRHSRKKL